MVPPKEQCLQARTVAGAIPRPVQITALRQVAEAYVYLPVLVFLNKIGVLPRNR